MGKRQFQILMELGFDTVEETKEFLEFIKNKKGEFYKWGWVGNE